MITPIITPPLPDLDLCLVEGGEFMMGDDNKARPAHRVRVSGFWMGKFPVTQRLWQAVMGSNPSSFKGERRPVENVSWADAVAFLLRLNRLTGKNFRLPTEAEWEYAACGGLHSQGYKYAGSDRAKQVAWHEANSGGETHEVGLLLPNELHLHDMSGNVWEWCQDWFSSGYYAACYQQGLAANPQGADSGESRVLRGGSWLNTPLGCRAVARDGNLPGNRHVNVGFRFVLPLS
jgi:formylglycine-generating enzyme required for sulfatase activity